MTTQSTVSPPELYPPKHYPKATNTIATAWPPEEQPTSEDDGYTTRRSCHWLRSIHREHKHEHLTLSRPGGKESIATDSKRSLQKIGMHLRSVKDCHRPLLEAIGLEIMPRALAVDETILFQGGSSRRTEQDEARHC
ncbi:hypothetical protein WJX79_002728 [Trebouxia sp. C0005]